jgi:hypothetical protein
MYWQVVLTVRAHAKNPTRKWHIWFLPTHKPTLQKTKRAIFCQRTDGQSDNNSNTFYIEK